MYLCCFMKQFIFKAQFPLRTDEAINTQYFYKSNPRVLPQISEIQNKQLKFPPKNSGWSDLYSISSEQYHRQ